MQAMNPDLLNLININGVTEEKVNLVVLLLTLAAFLAYSIFAFVVKKQVGILNKSIVTPEGQLLNIVASLHLLISLSLLGVNILLLIF